MRITGIETQKRRPGRKSIFIDGSFALGVSDETLLRSGLRKGDTVPPELLDELRSLEERTEVRSAALRLLARRPRATKELADRLRRKEYREETIRTVIDDLTRAGVLNDQAFAEMFVRDQMTLRHSGPRLLIQRLRRFGIEEEIIRHTLRAAEAGEEEGAEAAGRKYLRTRRHRTDPKKVRAGLSAFLSRRGFSWEAIRTTVEGLLGEHSEQDQ